MAKYIYNRYMNTRLSRKKSLRIVIVVNICSHDESV
jgi:hypothetical protein